VVGDADQAHDQGALGQVGQEGCGIERPALSDG
jgi:hypothetical protein